MLWESDPCPIPRKSTPAGGQVPIIIRFSYPLLSNIFLHYVLDLWMKETVQPRVGACRLVRYADDFAIALKNRQDGERVLTALGKRFARYGLTLHPTKTRVVHFRPKTGREQAAQNQFDFLGFTHMWGKSRQGRWVVRQFTARKRFARAVKSVWAWCKQHRHMPLGDQHRHLASVIRGHCTYYGLTGNGKRLSRFRDAVVRSWRYWLARAPPLREDDVGQVELHPRPISPCRRPRSRGRSTLLERICHARNRML